MKGKGHASPGLRASPQPAAAGTQLAGAVRTKRLVTLHFTTHAILAGALAGAAFALAMAVLLLLA